MSGKKIWFGHPTGHMQWVPAPLAGAEAQNINYVESIEYENGGADVYRSRPYRKQYDFEYSAPIKGSEELGVFNKFASGYYGGGTCIFADPYAFETNMLGPQWATPGLIEQGWKGIYTGDPTFGDVLGPLYTNLATNPSFETAAAGTDVVRTNLVINPSAEADASQWTGVVNCAVARSTAASFSGSASIAMTASGSTDVQAAASGSGTSGIPVTAGSPYTFSVYISSATVSRAAFTRLVWYNSAGTLVSFVDGSSSATQVGTFSRRSITSTAPATAAYVQLRIFFPSSAPSEVHYLDAALFEKSSTLGDYFDGSTPDALGIDYGWTGAANASTSTAKASTVTVRTNLASSPAGTNPTAHTTNIGPCALSLGVEGPVGASGFYRLTMTGTSIATGYSTYGHPTVSAIGENILFTGSLYVRSSRATTMRANLRSFTTGGTALGSDILGPDVAIPANTWTRLSATTTTLPTTTYVEVRARLTSTATALVSGDTLDISAVLIEASSILQDYFDGSTAAAGDFTYAWTGAANASTSVQRGVGVVGVTDDAQAVSFSSAEWFSTGSKSLRLSARGSSTSSNTYISLPTTIGASYTALIKMRLGSPLTGTLQANSRKLRMFNNTATVLLGEAQGGNVAGVQNLLVHFTATTTTTRAYLWNGASAGNGDVWWDDFLLVEGTYTGSYFDGSTVDTDRIVYSWTGTADASTSTAQYQYADYGQPPRSVTYDITTAAGAIPNERFTIPIPPTYTLHFGASGTSTGNARVGVRPILPGGAYDSPVLIDLLDPNGATRMNETFSGATYQAVEVFIYRTATVDSTITLASMMAQLWKTGTSPTLTGDHVPGDGHTGLEFADDARVETYLYINPPRKALSTTLVEVGAWR